MSVSLVAQPPETTNKYIPSLNGLRALSIALVLLGHINGTQHAFNRDLGIGDYAHLGVVVFFVISGFLITTLLLVEEEEKGSIALKRFYLRRAVRIFPCSYGYILCVFLLWWAGAIHLNFSDAWHAVTYTMNFKADPAWQVGHLWSLSVEEQFYLLWPIALVGLGRRGAAWAALSTILVGPFASPIIWHFLHLHARASFPVVAHSLATGCLLAMGIKWLERQRWYLQLFRPSISVLLVVLLLLINRIYQSHAIISELGPCAIDLILAVLIHRSIYRNRDAFGRFLNWRPVVFIGTLSYSLYVWQQLFLDRDSSAWAAAFPQNLLLAFAAALGSYFLLERPFLRLRTRLRSDSHRSSQGDGKRGPLYKVVST